MLIRIFIIIFICVLGCGYVLAKDKKDAAVGEDKASLVEYSASQTRDPLESWLPEIKDIGEIRDTIKRTGKGKDIAAPLPDFNLQGIVWGGEFAQAIIDGSVVRVGDTFKGVEIIEIAPDRIKLSYGEDIFYIFIDGKYDNKPTDDAFGDEFK